MPTLHQQSGAEILSVLPTTPGAVRSAGLITAAIIDADVVANPFSSIPYLQYQRAKELLGTWEDISELRWGQATNAMRLSCFVQYLKIDRIKRLNLLQVCEDEKEFQMKMGSFYTMICESWQVLGITDPFFCSNGFEGTAGVILEGKVNEPPNDTVFLH